MNLQRFKRINQLINRSILGVICFFLLAQSGFLSAQVQVVNTILPPDIQTCAPLGVFTINATYPATVTVPSNQITGSGYSTSTVPYAPIAPGGTSVALADDNSSASIPIGFTFNYYGTNYTNFSISSNGYIGFTPPLPGTFSYSADDMENDLCNSPNLPNNAIFGWYQDWNPAGLANAVQYQTTGVAPNRVLTVSWTNVPFWANSCPGTATFQIRIFETTGVIQIHIGNKPECDGMWQGDGLSGLATPCPEQAAGSCPTYSYSGDDIAVNNQAWQYTPIIPGSGIDVVASVASVEWTGQQGTAGSAFNVTGNNTSAQVSMITASQAKKKYIIKVTYDIPCANDLVLVDTFVVNLQPYDPAFTVVSPICLGNSTTVTYTGTSPISNQTVKAWNFGTGATPATANTIGPHTVSFNSVGTKTITLNLSGGGCAANSSTQTVVVTDAPTSTFTATATVCGTAPAVVTYTGNAPANATYTWNFDGGVAVPATGQGPFNVTWATPGTKTIRLTVSIGTCNSVETTAQVIVNPAPTSTFTIPPGGVCLGEPLVITYTGNANATATYTWGLDGGTSVPATGQGPLSVTWNTAGNKTLTLQVSQGTCQSTTTTIPVVVHALPLSTFTVTPSVCPGQNATTAFTGTAGAGTVYTWGFDGGTVASGAGAGPYNVNWATAGTYDLTLQVTSAQGCESTVSTQPVTVNPIPTASFTATPSSLCVGEETTLQYTGAASAGLTYLWNFDTGTANPGGTASATQDVNWSAAGNRNVSLRVVALGCTSAVVTNAIVINATPTATFTTSASVCTGNTVNVNYTGNGSAAALYTWNYAGGTPTGNTNPGPFTLGWNTPGPKAVSLIVEEFGCASQPYVQNVTVFQTPNSNFTASANVCAGSANNISYTGNAGVGATYAWAFPSGTPASPAGQGPHAVTWTTPGNYNLTLTVTENGCVSTQTQQVITVNAVPTSSFTAVSPICLDGNSPVTFTGSAGANALYTWAFDGGTPNSTTNPGPFSLTWPTAGTKNLSLTVTQNGCTSQPFTQNVIVNPVPTSLFSASSPVCIGSPSAVSYIGSASASANYAWTFTGSTPANPTGQGPHNATYGAAGTYFLSLTVTENGCVSPITQLQVIVNPIPTADFTVTSPICLDGLATVTYTGSANATSVYNWNFGGGITPIQVGQGPFEVSWLTPGTKTITLDVNALGCQSPTFTQTLTVLPLPTVDAGLDQQSCSGASVTLGTPPIPGYTYLWTPGNGLTDVNTSLTTASRTNNLAQPVDYEYILRADDGQCIAYDTVIYRVTAPPFVSFAAPQGQCLGGNSFDFQAEGFFSQNSTFIWNFGANANVPSSSIENPDNVSFGSTGSQTITLQITDGGCFSNLYSADVLVYPDPVVDFVAEVNSGCADLKVIFDNLSQVPGTVFYTWYFGDGGTSNSAEPSYTYTKAGLYDVSLKATTSNGCTATIDRKEYIEVYPVPVAFFSMNASELDMIAPDLIIAGGVLNTDSVWYYLDGDTLLGPNHNVTFTDTGYYQIVQVVENQFGCMDSVERYIKVNPGYRIYIPNSFSPNNDGTNDFFTVYGEEITDFEIVIFNRWGQQIYRSFDLSNGWDGTSALSENKVPQGVYLYMVKATDDVGFVHKFEGTVNVVK